MRLFRGSALAVFVLSAGVAGAVPVVAQLRERGLEARSLVVANRHLGPVDAVYFSSVADSDWGPNRLAEPPLSVGEDATIEMQGGCEADLRIVFPGGGAEERRRVNVCTTSRVVLRPGWTMAEELDEEGPVGAMPDEAESGALTLRNAGRLPIVELYAGPPGGPRGEDRLGDDILPVGASIVVEPADPDACEAELVAVFRDGREVTRTGVDLCAGEEIEIR